MPGKAKCERIAKNNRVDNVRLHFDRRKEKIVVFCIFITSQIGLSGQINCKINLTIRWKIRRGNIETL